MSSSKTRTVPSTTQVLAYVGHRVTVLTARCEATQRRFRRKGTKVQPTHSTQSSRHDLQVLRGTLVAIDSYYNVMLMDAEEEEEAVVGAPTFRQLGALIILRGELVLGICCETPYLSKVHRISRMPPLPASMIEQRFPSALGTSKGLQLFPASRKRALQRRGGDGKSFSARTDSAEPSETHPPMKTTTSGGGGPSRRLRHPVPQRKKPRTAI